MASDRAVKGGVVVLRGKPMVTRMRELYYYDYANDFGLSGFAGALCSRATLRTDAPVVLALAGAWSPPWTRTWASACSWGCSSRTTSP
ncbi:hypothetical protein [Streptomyces sp. NPDC058240]|uniref:hypothetical protein n=1 Tax=Streptomyces sp. NPDC058240 TaxID=3346396 RepID=UPI0036EDECEC